MPSMLRMTQVYFSNPNNLFHWLDIALVIGIYALSVVLFLERKRGFIAPLLVFGIFLFPVQFSIWFLASRVNIVFYPNLNFFELFYLVFLKLCLIASILSPKT
jgi:hypothetical protein